MESDAQFPFEIKSLQRAESHGQDKGWSNTFIVKMNRQTGETWILTHVGNELIWVLVPEGAKKAGQG